MGLVVQQVQGVQGATRVRIKELEMTGMVDTTHSRRSSQSASMGGQRGKEEEMYKHFSTSKYILKRG